MDYGVILLQVSASIICFVSYTISGPTLLGGLAFAMGCFNVMLASYNTFEAIQRWVRRRM